MIDEPLLPLLPSLVALVEEQSVTRAARRLGISQPRMSARLATLRDLTGDALLVPAARQRGHIATLRAAALADAARGALAALDTAFAQPAFDPLTAARTFTVMANDNAATIAGVPLVDAVRATAGPGVRIALIAHDLARLDRLEGGTLDLALGSPALFAASPSLLTRTIARDCFATATRDGDPLDLDAYCAREHVLVSGEGGRFDGVVDTALARLGRARRVAASVQSYLLAIELVMASDLVATLPRALLAGRGLTLAPPPLPLDPFTLAAAWHPRVAEDPAHRWLRERLFAG